MHFSHPTHMLFMKAAIQRLEAMNVDPRSANMALLDNEQVFAASRLMQAASSYALNCKSQGVSPNRNFQFAEITYQMEYEDDGEVFLIGFATHRRLISSRQI